MRTIQTAIDKAAKILVLFALSLSLPANAQTAYKTIHSFNRPTGGYPSFGDLISDASGNFYGVTSAGANTRSSLCGNYSGCGVVFKLSRTSSGGWSTTTLFAFSGTNGFEPQAGLVSDAAYSGMISDTAGNLYGTTLQGGNNSSLCSISGCGVVYKLSPGASGWTESVLYAFSGTDGYYPYASPILDAAGNLTELLPLAATSHMARDAALCTNCPPAPAVGPNRCLTSLIRAKTRMAAQTA
jgi:uncharacterized repeat protein (TIGR03803 family)